MGVDGRAFETLLAAQSQLVSREQARAAGISDNQIDWRIKAGSWRRMFPGVFLTYAFPPTHEQWCRAALLFAGDNARIWGASAARLHELWGFTPRPDEHDLPALPITVVVPHQQQISRQANLVVVRTRELETTDFATVQGLATCNAVRALIDSSAAASSPQLAMAVEHLRKRGQFSWLAMRLEHLEHGRRDLDPLRRYLERFPADLTAVESPLEAWCAEIMARHGLHPRRQWRISGFGKQARLDFAFVDSMLAVETDGRKTHANDPFFNSDRARWNWIENCGWSHLKFTWAHMHDEDYVISTILDRLAMLAIRQSYPVIF